MLKNLVFYFLIIGLFVGAVLVILHLGADLPPGTAETVTKPAVAAASTPQAETAIGADGAFRVFLENLHHPLSLLLMQLIVIVAATRIAGGLIRKIGQPSVIGEMVAGIMLGPSLLGMLWPASQSFLFPPSSMPALRLFSQVGVVLYMFLVGIDLDLGRLRQKAHAAILVSHASIVVPFFLGTALCLFIYSELAPSNIPFTPFALFLGIAMSITAFPVLARIIDERGLMGTFLGSTTIACAAVDDVTAWCLLAVVVAIASASGFGGAALTVALTVGFIAVALMVIRPQAARLASEEFQQEANSKGLVAGVLVFAFASALFTEAIGIHALFGAFLAGAVMPAQARLRSVLRARLEMFTTVLLLPLFFAFTGLRTQIGLLGDLQSWLLCLLIILVAVAGKFGGSTLAARWTGISWKESLAIGVLMNTRGLMELIVLNIGYDMGILSPHIFAMMVIMALTTTFMAGPLLALLGVGRDSHEEIENTTLAHAPAHV
ncbi:MAG TPA: cation:proton antiporter [Pirellulales bacterium]|jgi:Kef-type K+ transport system membrane component KefB